MIGCVAGRYVLSGQSSAESGGYHGEHHHFSAGFGIKGIIQDLFKGSIAEFMENGLETELDEDLGYSKYDYKNKATDNSRNGHSSKNLRTSFGDVEVSVPRDRKRCSGHVGRRE